MARIVYHDAAHQEVSIEIGPGNPEVTIGRNPGNQIRLQSPSISRYHAKITFENGRCVLHDDPDVCPGRRAGHWLCGRQRRLRAAGHTTAATAAGAEAHGAPEPSRRWSGSGSPIGSPLELAATAGHVVIQARDSTSSPLRKRCARTPPVARPLAG